MIGPDLDRLALGTQAMMSRHRSQTSCIFDSPLNRTASENPTQTNPGGSPDSSS
jgi:hypothetical protein